jgi:hypothetical protein
MIGNSRLELCGGRDMAATRLLPQAEAALKARAHPQQLARAMTGLLPTKRV